MVKIVERITFLELSAPTIIICDAYTPNFKTRKVREKWLKKYFYSRDKTNFVKEDFGIISNN